MIRPDIELVGIELLRAGRSIVAVERARSTGIWQRQQSEDFSGLWRNTARRDDVPGELLPSGTVAGARFRVEDGSAERAEVSVSFALRRHGRQNGRSRAAPRTLIIAEQK